MKSKYMIFDKLNSVIIGIIFIVACSIAWDVFNSIKSCLAINYLENYITFEQIGIESEKQQWINQIHTSIAFKNPIHRNELLFLTGFDTSSVEVLEDQILIMHPGLNTLDSMSYGNEDILNYRQLMNKSKNQVIKTFYKELLRSAMLETLASDVYDDSDCGFYNLGWKIIRPISSDSAYIGSVFYSDGRSKYAYQINGIYYEGFRNRTINGIYLESLQNSNIYTIPKSDTLNIYTIGMHNTGTKIDTQITNQRIKFDGKRWRNIGETR